MEREGIKIVVVYKCMDVRHASIGCIPFDTQSVTIAASLEARVTLAVVAVAFTLVEKALPCTEVVVSMWVELNVAGL